MKSLTNFLKDMPGVRPLKARALILDGGMLTKAERADIHYCDGWDMILEVGPDAAAAILGAYRAGRLPMKPHTAAGEAPEAEAYLAQRETLLATLAERSRRARARRDPSLIRETDFDDYSLLNGVFFEAYPKGGNGTLTLAGIAVRKSIAGYSSNSGKSRGHSVSFDWVGSDGVPRSTGREASEAFNRRNSADRDWGLPGG